MTRPPTTGAEGETLLHGSADRTLVLVRMPGGAAELVKIYERGTLEDAQRELAMGRRLAGLGVARYLAAEIDPASGRPCVRMQWHSGTDLETLVGERGALAAAEAAAILARVADTLAAMHGLEAPDAPRGLVHGDVKPGNILVGEDETLLLDLERVAPRPAPDLAGPEPGGFSGGTHGFAPPEAYAGAPASPAFDVFGLGMSLHFCLAGQLTDPDALRGQAASVRRLIADCTARRPEDRPAMAAVADRLRELAAALRDDPAETVLAELQAARLERAAAALQSLASDDPRRGELQELLARRRRLLQRAGALPAEGEERMPADPARLRALLLQARAVLRRFPRHQPSLTSRSRIRAAAVRLLLEMPVRVAELSRKADYATARELLQGCLGLLDALQEEPGRFQVPGDGPARMPGILQRNPRRFLARTLREVDHSESALAELLGRLEAAEKDLDLTAAEAVVQELAGLFGGASPVTAGYKDRLHRLGFYIERIAGSRPRLDRFADVLHLTAGKVELQALYDLVDRCKKVRGRTREDSGGLGMRGLQLTLRDLAEEFPALAGPARDALGCLHDALVEATGIAWRLLGEASEKLAAEPVPVRPLQSILNRLDSLRLVEAFLDLPEQPRSALLDRIETVRMKVEQARATRDRIARGAEAAMARGHWTTGLFDMERAVAHLQDEAGDEAPESKRLLERLEQAKRRKAEIERAAHRNVELASRYATLQDIAGSPVEERLAVLEKRSQCLEFLVHNVPAERAELYARDLREVQVLVAQELAARAEQRWDATADPGERLAIARGLLARLEPSAQDTGQPVGRVQRLIAHWHRQEEEARRELARRAEQQAEHRRRARRRSHLGLLAGAAAALLLFAWGFSALAGEGREGALLRQLDELLGRAPPVTAVAADPVGTILTLSQAVGLLEAAGHAAAPPAAALASALRRPAGPPAQWDPAYWRRHFTEQIRAYAKALPPGQAAPALANLGTRLWRTGIALAVLAAGDPAAIEPWRQEADRLAAELGASWLSLPDEFVAELRQALR